MKYAFDLDGTLDRPGVAELCRSLLERGDEVHAITGVFDESGDWQSDVFKAQKLSRQRIPFTRAPEDWYKIDLLLKTMAKHTAMLHVLHAVPETYSREYRLADLGLRKGALCEFLGVGMLFDDSPTYCEMAPRMHGNLIVMHVR